MTRFDRRDVWVYIVGIAIATVLVWALVTGSPENPVGHAYRVVAELLAR